MTIPGFLLALPLALVAHVPPGQSADVPSGEWRNPDDTVHVRTHDCGDGALCGTITWASEQAKADAREAGTQELVGTQLFRNFRRSGADAWEGEVFVPDLDRSFSGTLSVEGDTLVGEGCAALGLLCKSQRWSRIE